MHPLMRAAASPQTKSPTPNRAAQARAHGGEGAGVVAQDGRAGPEGEWPGGRRGRARRGRPPRATKRSYHDVAQLSGPALGARRSRMGPVLDLGALGHAAIAAGVLDLGALPEAVALLLDLHRQLSRRRHDQDDRAIASGHGPRPEGRSVVRPRSRPSPSSVLDCVSAPSLVCLSAAALGVGPIAKAVHTSTSSIRCVPLILVKLYLSLSLYGFFERTPAAETRLDECSAQRARRAPSRGRELRYAHVAMARRYASTLLEWRRSWRALPQPELACERRPSGGRRASGAGSAGRSKQDDDPYAH